MLVTLACLWLNLRVPGGGIVDNALLDASNAYRRWNEEASQTRSITQGDTVSFVLDFPNGMDRPALQQVVDMTGEVQALFPEGVVWSLAANSRTYRADDQQLASEAHLSSPLPATVDLAQWRTSVSTDTSAYGTLVGKQFDHAQILLFLPAQHDELALVDRVAQYLEARTISQVEWLLWKGDIHPAARYANVSVGGWAVARGLMHYALISDVMRYATIGLLVATVAAMLALGSWRQAVLVSTVIFLSFVVVRGAVAALALLDVQFAGEPLKERVYFLLVLSALIVSGISFNVRAFEAFNEAWRQARSVSAPPDPARLWQDSLRQMGMRFTVVATIAVLNFATLPQIGIRGILEVGVLSALGVALQRLMVVTLLPALHLYVGGEPTTRTTHRWDRLGAQLRRCVQIPPGLVYHLWARRTPARSLAWCLGITGGVLAVALTIGVHDALHPSHRWIQVRERPIDYLPHTIVDRGRAILNREGSSGFGTLHYLVRPASGSLSAEDPAFLAEVQALQNEVARLPGAEAAHSILDKLSEVSQRDPQTTSPLPLTRQQAHEQLQLIQWDMDSPRLPPHFWSDEGMVLFVGHPADDSATLRAFAEQVMTQAQRHHPTLQVLPFGRLQTYHQTDAYISQGKPLNVLTSFPLVVLACGLWLMWERRRLGTRHPTNTLAPWRTALAISIPFVFAYAVVMVVMAAADLPLDQATACATALGINAAIDFDIYLVDDFQQALRRQLTPDQALAHALRDQGHITVIDMLLNTVCFSLLMCSAFVPIQRLGLLLVVLLAACAFGALLLMTGVLRSCVVPPPSSTPSVGVARP